MGYGGGGGGGRRSGGRGGGVFNRLGGRVSPGGGGENGAARMQVGCGWRRDSLGRSCWETLFGAWLGRATWLGRAREGLK